MLNEQEQCFKRVSGSGEIDIQESEQEQRVGRNADTSSGDSSCSTASMSHDNAALTDDSQDDESQTPSEVAHILKQIREEYEAAQRGFTGFAYTSQHAFITARMEHMSDLQSQLQDLIGDIAIPMVADQLNSCPDITQVPEP